jgi:hypothetical protein
MSQQTSLAAAIMQFIFCGPKTPPDEISGKRCRSPVPTQDLCSFSAASDSARELQKTRTPLRSFCSKSGSSLASLQRWDGQATNSVPRRPGRPVSASSTSIPPGSRVCNDHCPCSRSEAQLARQFHEPAIPSEYDWPGVLQQAHGTSVEVRLSKMMRFK